MIDGKRSPQTLIDVAEINLKYKDVFDISGRVLSNTTVSLCKFLSFDRGECWETLLASFRDGTYFNNIIAWLAPTINLWTGSLFGNRVHPFPKQRARSQATQS